MDMNLGKKTLLLKDIREKEKIQVQFSNKWHVLLITK